MQIGLDFEQIMKWKVRNTFHAPINCFLDGRESGQPPGNRPGKVTPGAEI